MLGAQQLVVSHVLVFVLLGLVSADGRDGHLPKRLAVDGSSKSALQSKALNSHTFNKSTVDERCTVAKEFWS